MFHALSATGVPHAPSRGDFLTRRAFIRRSTASLGSVALASLLEKSRALSATSAAIVGGVVNPLHHRQSAKRVIYLYMAGGPSHLETFDYKPKLAEMHGQPMPESLTKGQPIAQLQNSQLTCFAPQHPFARYGKSQQEICTIFPRIGSVADEICIVRSLQTDAINHDPALAFMNTGTTIPGRPSMGSWVLYGLGSECDDLPGFVVLRSSGRFGQAQPIPARLWHSGFLSSRFQGVEFRSQGDPVLYVGNPPGVTASQQAEVIAASRTLNEIEDQFISDPELSARISQYEMAFRMQASVPQLIDISDEPRHVLDLYGTEGADGSFGANCLLARRLAERGVRFIQLYHRDWDHHGDLKKDIAGTAAEVDRGTAALITDLRQRGLLEDTLIVWGGEFGRTPMAQGTGRDHHIKGFSAFLAGGGIKAGMSYGATDELGYNAVENPVHVHDLHATMLHLLGIEHTRLTFRSEGRDFRLTDVKGEVVRQLLA